MPCACYIVGALLLMRFSFNEDEHRAVRVVLDARQPQSALNET